MNDYLRNTFFLLLRIELIVLLLALNAVVLGEVILDAFQQVPDQSQVSPDNTVLETRGELELKEEELIDLVRQRTGFNEFDYGSKIQGDVRINGWDVVEAYSMGEEYDSKKYPRLSTEIKAFHRELLRKSFPDSVINKTTALPFLSDADLFIFAIYDDEQIIRLLYEKYISQIPEDMKSDLDELYGSMYYYDDDLYVVKYTYQSSDERIRDTAKGHWWEVDFENKIVRDITDFFDSDLQKKYGLKSQ